MVLILGGLAAAAAVWGFLFEPHRVGIARVELPCEELRDGPVRILLFSDVDYVSEGRRESALRRAAAEFAPDLVLVAGDFVERAIGGSGETLRGAESFLASLPATAGRLLAPGEEESAGLETLRKAWTTGAVEVVSNEPRRFRIRGEDLDVFVSNLPADPPAWTLSREAGPSFVECRGRSVTHALVYHGPGAGGWRDVEITLAFEAVDPGAYLDIRFAWEPDDSPSGGRGYRLLSHEYSPRFRLVRAPGGRLEGRTASEFLPPTGPWCRARIRLTDEGDATRIRARFWPAWAAEPPRWSIDARDRTAERRTSGTVALGARAGARRYADLRVAEPGGAVLLDEPFRDPARLDRLWAGSSALVRWLRASASGARVVLVHHPDVVLVVRDAGGSAPCVVLAGHTHGGQVRIPGLGALYTDTRIGTRYDRGLFRFAGIPLYITPGLGTSLIPLRLFDPPEITLVTLVPARSG